MNLAVTRETRCERDHNDKARAVTLVRTCKGSYGETWPVRSDQVRHGTGIDAASRKRGFEPFPTKERQGHGWTVVVYGVISNTMASIEVDRYWAWNHLRVFGRWSSRKREWFADESRD